MYDYERLLPELILLENFKGNWDDFYKTVYDVFCKDFVETKPIFRGKKLGLKKHPIIDGKEYTFYHMISEGKDETNRTPDIARCERIKWAKFGIEQCDNLKLKVWQQIRNGKKRICIWIEVEDGQDYMIILDVREKYVLPWTTFTLKYGHEKRKKQKEFENYLKTARAVNIKVNGSVTPSTHG